MIVMRCAWHPKYRGYPWIYEVDMRLGEGLVVSDGMCRSCARRWRSECRAGNVVLEGPAPSPIIPGWVPRAGLGVALAAAVILAASPLDVTGMRPSPDTRAAVTTSTPVSALPAAVTSARFESAAAQAAAPQCAAPATARSRKPIRAVAARRPAETARRATPARTPGGEGMLCRPLQALRTVFPRLDDCRTLFARGGGASSETLLAQAP